MRQSKRDVGWFCHEVPLRKHTGPAPAPPISQIPLLGLMPEPKEEPPSLMPKFRPTDTPYIQLSRMGGRKDLLCFRENPPDRGYVEMPPRCQWFYLEDNSLDHANKETEKKEEYVFKVPCYMTSMPPASGKPPSPPPREISPLPKKNKLKKGKLPDSRPGYAEYNKRLNKVGIARREYVNASCVGFPKKKLNDQPNSMAELLAHKYTEDYDEYRKQWREVDNLMKPRASCKPVVPKMYNTNPPVRKKKW
ncbi:hypothetical protein AAHC03_016683 [Spirometra sp. Aus1]